MEQHVYDQFNELEEQHWWFSARRKYLDKIIKSLQFNHNEAHKFCEIGSGTGGNLAMLCRYAKVDAVEMNDDARKIIERKQIAGVQNVFSGYLPDNMPLKKKYDAVFSLDVIEHVEDDQAAVAQIKQYLRDDGWLVTTVPAYQWLWSAHDDANHHKRRYTKTQYCSLLESAGYDIVYASYFNTILFPLAVLERFFTRLVSGNENNDHAVLKLPSKLINTVFTILFGLESNWAGKLRMPFGLSIVVVAKVK